MGRFVKVVETNQEAVRRRFGGFVFDSKTGKMLDRRKPYCGMKRPPRAKCTFCGRRVRGPNHMDHCKGPYHAKG